MTAAKKLANAETYLEAGIVERVVETIEVRLWNGHVVARRAKSCLVAPEIGDKVLCSIGSEGVFVLAVLEGQDDSKTKITSNGDLELHAQGGRIAVRAAGKVDIVGGHEVSMTSSEVRVHAQKGSVSIDELGFLGRNVQAHANKIVLVAQEVDSMLTRLSQRAKRVFRFIEETDQTRAGTVDMRAHNVMALRGESAVISARVLTKVDGEQIHVG